MGPLRCHDRSLALLARNVGEESCVVTENNHSVGFALSPKSRVTLINQGPQEVRKEVI